MVLKIFTLGFKKELIKGLLFVVNTWLVYLIAHFLLIVVFSISKIINNINIYNLSGCHERTSSWCNKLGISKWKNTDNLSMGVATWCISAENMVGI
jgi:hypothetical protein